MDTRDRLIEILCVPIYPRVDADPAEVVADYLLDNDVTLVTHAHWIFESESSLSPCKCSECLTSYGRFDTPYCPNCGAKMDGVNE